MWTGKPKKTVRNKKGFIATGQKLRVGIPDGSVSYGEHLDRIKVDGKWKTLTIHLYETHHGPIPQGSVPFFIDGNNRNHDPSNIGLMSIGEAKKYGKKMTAEALEVLRLARQLSNIINERKKHFNIA